MLARLARRSTLACVLFCALLASVPAAKVDPISGVYSTSCPGADTLPVAVNLTQAKLATTCLLNRIRSAANLPSLRPSARLERIATLHNADMLARSYFAHGSFRSRLVSIGWHAAAGENIGYGTAYYATPRSMVWGWMRSEGHRENILYSKFVYVAVSVLPGTPVPAVGPAATYTADFGGVEW